MSHRRAAARALALLGLLLGPSSLAPPPPTRPAPAAHPGRANDASCRICHPSATRGLRHSAHAFLLEERAATACTACHGDLSAHADAANSGTLLDRQLPIAAVDAQACAACHDAESHADTARGAHPWRPDDVVPVPFAVAAPATAIEAAAGPLPALETPLRRFGMDWSGMLAAGVRFIDRHGSRERYETDLNLDPGVRLKDVLIEGHSVGANDYLDHVRIAARDIADPYQRIDAEVEKRGLYAASGRFEKTIVKYRATGDFHRVDQRHQRHGYRLSLEPANDVELFASWFRTNDDGFWLTNRLGNRNLTPQTTVAGVESPRQLDADELEVGLATTILGTAATVAFEYLDQQQRSQWSYAQPSPVNPAFPESEDFLSSAALFGPSLRASLARDFGPLNLAVTGRVLDLERRVLGNGEVRGFDIGEFVTTTTSRSAGSARTWLLDGTATLELTDWSVLVADLRWVDHQEELRIDQLDVTVFPTLSTTTTVPTQLDQRTAQRQFEGSVQVDVEPLEGLVLSAGYGWSREWLSVPDLEAGDEDFRSGLIQNDGALVGLQWRPDDHWTLDLRHREFGQNGIQLHDLAEDRARRSTARLRYRRDTWSLEGHARYRLRENDVSRTRYEGLSAGALATLHPSEALDLHASYTFADVDARTLTNFYFDPDPNPVPTFVGFDGATHTFVAGLTAQPSRDVTWRLDGTVTDTDGSFDLRLWDVLSDLSIAVLPGGEAGVQFRWVDYADATATDAYDAGITFLYWRQRFGGASHRASLAP
ncbi:MAG: hypothetical protein AAF628_33835 [Planctomycetota bacterium]